MELLNLTGVIDKGAGTVWYTYTATENTAISLDTFGSDYDTFIAVFVDRGSGLEVIACDHLYKDTLLFPPKAPTVAFQVENGTTYYIEVGKPTK
jgi:hypothetical protein